MPTRAGLVRAATPADVGAVHDLVVALATYERAAHEVIATPSDLERALFGPAPRVFAHVVEHEGTVVGFALWFTTYSTWLGRHGLWLEDLFVLPEHRGADLCRQRLGSARVERARLERARPRLLPRDRRPAARRVDRPSPER
jgi:GNAT superfamily N-acetyltransferase